jgi:hypothetical protein
MIPRSAPTEIQPSRGSNSSRARAQSLHQPQAASLRRGRGGRIDGPTAALDRGCGARFGAGPSCGERYADAEGCSSGTTPDQPARSTATRDDGVITSAGLPGVRARGAP